MEVNADQSDYEGESALGIVDEEQPINIIIPSFSRQSSVYSLTLDEFQDTLTGSGQNFESMNMDEFLKSIWTAEENEAQAQNANTAMPAAAAPITSVSNMNPQYQLCETSNERGNMARQMSLTRQGSLSVPAPLCQKTVDEVWSVINRTQQSTDNCTQTGSKQSGSTYGEMTLEEFLVKAGVVREEGAAPAQPPPPQHQIKPQPQPQPQPQLANGIYINGDSTAASSFMVLGCGGAGTGSVGVPPPFKALPQTGGANVAACLPGGKCSAFKPLPQTGGANVSACLPGGESSASACQAANGWYGGKVTYNGCVTESSEQMSPVSSDGIGMSKPGRKRIIDGPVERVIERQQKRMIKNRESAARSRERKHAYTLELEAELNHLKDENVYLTHRLADLETRAKQQQSEAEKAKAKGKLGLLRRSFSSPF